MNDESMKVAHAHHVALSGAVTAIYNNLIQRNSADRALIQIEAAKYIDNQLPEGTEENRASKEFLRQTLLWDQIRQL